MSADYTYVRVPSSSAYLARFIRGIINLIVGIIIFLLFIRFVLALFGASPLNEFMQWLLAITGAILSPFYNIFPTWYFGNGFAIEWTTLFAIIIYAFLGWIAVRVVNTILYS